MTSPDISADFRKMINNPEYSDVAFCCNDGKRVHASRLLLAARSEVLHRMLLNGMAESHRSDITLHEISSSTLLPTLEFLYTGVLQDYAPKDWRNAYEIIDTARFFLLGALESTVMDYLQLAVAKVKGDIEAAAKFLSITVEFIAILGETVEFIAGDLVCILELISFEPRHLQALTGDAFLYFLRATVNGGLMFEFLRLRNIILWCACKEFAPQTPLALHTVPPEIKFTLDLLHESAVQERETPQQSETNILEIKSRLANSVKQYLHLVDLRQIRPHVLVNIVEPMDIISSKVLIDVFRFNMLHNTDREDYMYVSDWLVSYKTKNNYTTSSSGSVIGQVAPSIGYAKYNLTFNLDSIVQPGRKYEWEITIEKVCNDFIEIGLLEGGSQGKFISNGDCNLSEQPGGWALRMDRQGLSINRKEYRHDPSSPTYNKDYSQLVYGEHYGHINSKVKVCFERILGKRVGRCSFTIDNENYGEAWDDMPITSFFPAVSLGTGSGGRVRIRIIRS